MLDPSFSTNIVLFVDKLPPLFIEKNQDKNSVVIIILECGVVSKVSLRPKFQQYSNVDLLLTLSALHTMTVWLTNYNQQQPSTAADATIANEDLGWDVGQ